MVRSVSQHIPQLRFEWEIDDLWRDGSLESGTFGFFGLEWRLRLEILTNNNFLNPYRGISVILLKINSSDVHGHLRIQSFIEDEHKKAQHCVEKSFSTSSESSKLLWQKLLLVADVKSLLTANAALTFVVSLYSARNQPVKEKDEKGVQAHMNAERDASAEGLAVDFRRLLDDSTHSDVTLKSGGITIPAHRVVLSARSDVFAAMLRSDMEESRSGIVEISDVDPPILDQLVQFIYSGKLSDLTAETAPQLFEAGDKYAVETLKSQCSAFMKENLAEENACSILVLADAHSDKDLRDCAISFIMDTDLTQKDDIWNRFCGDHPKLAIEVLNRSLKAAKSLK